MTVIGGIVQGLVKQLVFACANYKLLDFRMSPSPGTVLP